MLPANLLIMSMAVFLTTAVSTAPLEEKELEEVEVEATEEGEVSEEEEDDDDSKSQDKIEGAFGRQRTTTATVVVVGAAGGSGVSSGIQDLSASSGQTAGGRTHEGTAGSSAGSAAAEISDVSTALIHSAGAKHSTALSHTETNGSAGAGSETNSNGQKLLNGGGGGGVGSQTDAVGFFQGEVSHLGFTESIEPSSHDFLLGLMGGDAFSSDGHVNIPGNMTAPPHLESSGVTVTPHADQNSLNSPADLVHHSDTTVDQPGPDQTFLSSGLDQSLPSSVSGSSHSAGSVSSSSTHIEALRDPKDAADSANTDGNGRQTLLTDTNGAETEKLISLSDLYTDLTGGAESVTRVNVNLTVSGLGFGHDVTESPSIMDQTASVDVTQTHNPVSGVHPHTDLVTMTADFSGTDTVATDHTGKLLNSSLPAVTDHTQMAGSVTEQYNPSGQGPEGAENVELEDTC
ncbi:uncharacterized protein si:ch211-80h18.1 isoform X1 [Oreochromis niloticus]|uniref:uncharacterized protein si:ch211-80h18.1 isoform X1 n=2 Tax=Oreochromis TaxID=8139 RepID=UPI000DF2A555|nr:uncharacterized protein LOC100691966 isoform X1 [Oreochromis niloticus]